MIPTEHEEQKALIKWFDLQYPKLRGRLAACPNGGQRNVIVATKLKAEGVRAGYLDLNLLTPRQGFSGLFIEMKRVKGGSVSDDQSSWIEWLREQGFRVEVCRGFDAAKGVITDYLSG